MKRMKKLQIDNEANMIKNLWIARYGERNANKLSLAVRRLFRPKKIHHVGL